MDLPTETADATTTLPGVTPGMEAAREGSLNLLEQRLPPEQAAVLKAERKSKKAAAATAPAAEAPPVKTEPVKETPVTEPETEVIDFSQSTTTPEAKADETPAEDLSAEELAKLDEKARKRYLDNSKEAAKVRKRAQEAEAKLTEHASKLTEKDAQLTELSTQLADLQQRGAALAGNQFGRFTDAQQVAAWGENAKEALLLLNNHERAVKAGRADASDTITHALPGGEEIELSTADRAALQHRVNDAQGWFQVDHMIGQNREVAKKITERHASTKGFTEARDAYLKDPALHTRTEELAAKAALYDTLMARRALITFPDTAGAATKAPSDPAARNPGTAAKKPAPPSETPASTPRMAHSVDGDDVAARKSQLMEQARTAKTYDEQQKYLKQAMMLPSPNRTFAVPAKRAS